jgi:hypothetical protein
VLVDKVEAASRELAARTILVEMLP